MNIFLQLEIVDEQGRHHVPDPELAELAREILDLYISLRPAYAPGRVTVPKKQYIRFYRAAELCRERAQTPVQFVTLQLEGMARTGNFWPSAIANPDYQADPESPHIVGQSDLAYYKSQLISYWARASIYGPLATLEDRTLRFSPLFRAVMANQLGQQDVVEQNLASALIELEARPIARQVFDGHLGFLHARIHRESHQHSPGPDGALPDDC